jgi:hypothetical protein
MLDVRGSERSGPFLLAGIYTTLQRVYGVRRSRFAVRGSPFSVHRSPSSALVQRTRFRVIQLQRGSCAGTAAPNCAGTFRLRTPLALRRVSAVRGSRFAVLRSPFAVLRLGATHPIPRHSTPTGFLRRNGGAKLRRNVPASDPVGVEAGFRCSLFAVRRPPPAATHDYTSCHAPPPTAPF